MIFTGIHLEIGVIKGNDPLNIFKDLLAYASVSIIDNTMFSLERTEDIPIKVIHCEFITEKMNKIDRTISIKTSKHSQDGLFLKFKTQ